MTSIEEQLPDIRTVEIGGVKVDIDMRYAKKVESYRIGDRVKVLVKSYSNYKPYPGVIVAFDMFEKLPTITVAYVKNEYNSSSIEFAYIHGGDKDDDQPEIAPLNDDILLDKGGVLESFQYEIEKKRAEIEDIERKRSYFLTHFDRYFADAEASQ